MKKYGSAAQLASDPWQMNGIIWDTNNHRVLLALTSYHMNQHDYCTYSVHQRVTLSLWDVLRQELPNLPSPFVKHPCITSALYKEMKVSAGQLSSLGAGPAAWLGLRSHVGSERERQREREREKRCHLRIGPHLSEQKRKQHAEKMRSLSIHLYLSFCQTSILKKTSWSTTISLHLGLLTFWLVS